jgi:hypothetical protein
LPRTIAPAPRKRRDTNRVCGRDIVDQYFGVAGRRQTGDIEDVLDANGHAVQRAARPSRGDFVLGRFCRFHGGLGIQPDEHVEFRVELLDARQQRLGQFDGRELAGGNRAPLRPQSANAGRSSPVPTFIGSQGSARGSVGAFILAAALLAAVAAATISSAKSAKALSSPARRARSSISALSISVLPDCCPL